MSEGNKYGVSKKVLDGLDIVDGGVGPTDHFICYGDPSSEYDLGFVEAIKFVRARQRIENNNIKHIDTKQVIVEAELNTHLPNIINDLDIV